MNHPFKMSIWYLSALIGSVLVSPTYAVVESSSSAKTESPSSNKSTTNCGLRSAINLASFLGSSPDAKQLSALHKAYPQPQLSMSEVREICSKLKVPVNGRRIRLSELEKLKQPFIAYWPDHFVFVEQVQNNIVRYVEENYRVGEFLSMSLKDFEKKYLGVALVLDADKKFDELSVWPKIQIDKPLPYGSSVKYYSIALANKTQKVINIKDISTSCSCTVPSRVPQRLNPGERASIQIKMLLPDEGSYAQTILIKSDSKVPFQTIWLNGVVEADVDVTPARLNFGTTTVNSTKTQILQLSDKMHKLSRPIRVSTSSPHLTAKLQPRSSNSWDVSVTLNAPDQIKDIESELLISGSEPGGRVLHIPVNVHLVPMTKASPGQVSFGSVASNIKNIKPRHIEIARQDQQPIEITKLTSPDFLQCEVIPLNDSHQIWTLKVTLDRTKVSGQISEKILVHTRCGEKEETLSVPVFGLIEAKFSAALPSLEDAQNLPRAEADPTIKIGLPLPTIKPGEYAPDFHLRDCDGNMWSMHAMRGVKNVLLTFFPKCFTGGCTTQLVSLRDRIGDFDAIDTQILAVSVDYADGENGQKAFAEQWHLNFPLIPDSNREICRLYGAVQQENERAARLTYFIDKKGIVRYVDTHVNVHTHATDLLGAIAHTAHR